MPGFIGARKYRIAARGYRRVVRNALRNPSAATALLANSNNTLVSPGLTIPLQANQLIRIISYFARIQGEATGVTFLQLALLDVTSVAGPVCLREYAAEPMLFAAGSLGQELWPMNFSMVLNNDDFEYDDFLGVVNIVPAGIKLTGQWQVRATGAVNVTLEDMVVYEIWDRTVRASLDGGV